MDGATPINPSSVMYDGTEIHGAADLRGFLLRYSEQFVRTTAEKLLTYALGRGVEYYDMPVVRSVVRDAAKDDYRFGALIAAVVKSEPFLMNTKSAGARLRTAATAAVNQRRGLNMAFLTNKTLPRRTFLRGVGATVALPLLESMVPALSSVARAQTLTPTRFAGIFVPHGAAPGYWIPQSSARGFEYPFIWKPLEPFRKHVVLTSGLWAQSAENPPGVTGADHFVAAAYLCATKPKKATGADIEAGTTIDQVIAQHVGQETLLPSLQLAVEDPGANASTCGEGYSCVYTNTISWQTPVRPLPMQVNPQVVFERLFGDGGTPEERTHGASSSAVSWIR